MFKVWVFPCRLLSPRSLSVWLDRFSPLSLADEEGPEGLTQFLMTEVRRLREARKSQLQREQQLQARGRVLEEERAGLEQRLREQQQAQERCQRLREDWEAGSLELLRLKDENYMIAMRLAQLSEEKNSAVLRSRDLQLAVGAGGRGPGWGGCGRGATSTTTACCVVAGLCPRATICWPLYPGASPFSGLCLSFSSVTRGCW